MTHSSGAGLFPLQFSILNRCPAPDVNTEPMKSKLGFFRHCFLVTAISFVVATSLHARPAKPDYLPDGKPNAVKLLAPPPMPDSAEQAADLAEVVAVHDQCTAAEASLADSEQNFFIFSFEPAIGAFFQPGKLPKTEAFFHRVQAAVTSVEDNAKDYWKRPRPYVVDPVLANGKLEKSFSYPSGHSTRATVDALLLAEMFPDKRDAILAEGRAIGWHRVEIAHHYPTDIYAGRVLAQAIVREMKKNADFKRDFADVKSELAAAQEVDHGTARAAR